MHLHELLFSAVFCTKQIELVNLIDSVQCDTRTWTMYWHHFDQRVVAAHSRVVSARKTPISGEPDADHISTSFIEKQNHTLRMHCRRLTRLTNAFSKKLENFRAAVGLHYGYYNLVKRHKTIRMTPALKAGVVKTLWSVEDLIREAALAV